MKHALPVSVASSRAVALFAAAAIAMIGLLAWDGADAATVGAPAAPDEIAAVGAGPTVEPDTAAASCVLQSVTRRYLQTGRIVNGVLYILFENVRVSRCTDGILTQRTRFWERDVEPYVPLSRAYGRVGQEITFTLPAATAGNAPFTYALAQDSLYPLEGFSFDAATRVFKGTPDATRAYLLSYSVRDVDGDQYDGWFNVIGQR